MYCSSINVFVLTFGICVSNKPHKNRNHKGSFSEFYFHMCNVKGLTYRLNYSIVLILANRFKNPIKIAFFTIVVYFSCISDRNWFVLVQISLKLPFAMYKARHAHKRLYTVLPKYSKIQVLPGITSCRLVKDNKQAIELNSLLINNMPEGGYEWN